LVNIEVYISTLDILMTYQDVISGLESPFPFDFMKFRVQFVCNRGGIYGQYGRFGRFFLLFVDKMDSVDTCIRHGQTCK
jgi:hypothetical protein